MQLQRGTKQVQSKSNNSRLIQYDSIYKIIGQQAALNPLFDLFPRPEQA